MNIQQYTKLRFFSIYTEYKLEMKINLIDQSCLYLIWYFLWIFFWALNKLEYRMKL